MTQAHKLEVLTTNGQGIIHLRPMDGDGALLRVLELVEEMDGTMVARSASVKLDPAACLKIGRWLVGEPGEQVD